ncbi:hypothetical protein ACIF85_41230, partial [Streptomyces sp. NPDC086033]
MYSGDGEEIGAPEGTGAGIATDSDAMGEETTGVAAGLDATGEETTEVATDPGATGGVVAVSVATGEETAEVAAEPAGAPDAAPGRRVPDATTAGAPGTVTATGRRKAPEPAHPRSPTPRARATANRRPP